MQENNDSKYILHIPFTPSTIETIDRALVNYVDKELNLSTDTNRGFEKVPVIWVSSERAFLSKKRDNNNNFQDNKFKNTREGLIRFPVITVQRTGMEKDPEKKGGIWGNVPPMGDKKGASIQIAKRLMQSKTKEFANNESFRRFGQANSRFQNKKKVYEFISIPQVVYVAAQYSIKLRTEYIQQMNQLVTPFITKSGHINYQTIEQDQHKYEVFIEQGFNQSDNSDNMSEEERYFETEVNIEVLGYLFGEDANEEQPFFTVRESIAEFRFSREVHLTGNLGDL